MLSAFGFQALGVLAGTAVGYEVLHNIPDIGAWRWMYATAIVPALLVTIGRFFVLESASWQLSRGRIEEAEQTTASLLRRHPPYPRSVRLDPGLRHHSPHGPHLAPLCGSLQPEQPSGDDPGLGALVPAGSRDLWHRHLHPDHPGRLPRP